MNKIFVILPLTLILCLLVSCQDKEARAELGKLQAELQKCKSQAELEEQNQALVLRWVEEDAKGNYDIWEEVCSPNYKFYYSSTGEPISLDEHMQMWKTFRKAFPDIKSTIVDITAKGDKVILRKILRGTHKAEFMGIKPTGNEFEYSAIEIYRISNGKVLELWGQGDMLGFYQQLGMVLAPQKN
jgi:predicted ester cyclase